MLSGATFVATEYWYRTTNPKQISYSEAPIAHVTSINNEVLRKPTTQQIWLPIGPGEALYNKELIKTDPSSEVEIHFLDGKTLNLGPDSIVVVQKNEEQVALELMKGNISIDTSNVPNLPNKVVENNLVVKTKTGVVELEKNSKINFNKKSRTSDELDLQVVDGRALVKDNTGKSTDITSGKAGSISSKGVNSNKSVLHLTYPNLTAKKKKIFVSSNNKYNVPFKWKTTNLPESKITLWIAKFNCKDTKSEIKDPINCLDRNQEMGPVQSANSKEGQLNYKLAPGQYKWKLVAEKNEQVIAETNAATSEVIARANAIVTPTYEKVAKTFPTPMQIEWTPSDEYKNVVIELAKDKELTQKIQLKNSNKNHVKIAELPAPGEYFMRTTVYYKDDEQNPVSSKIESIKVASYIEQEPFKLTFDNLKKQIHYLPTKEQNPEQVSLAWSANRISDVGEWKLKIIKDNEDKNKVPFISMGKNLSYKKSLTEVGNYTAILQTYDKNGNPLGNEFVTSIEIKERALPETPEFTFQEEVIRAKGNGKVEIKTTAVADANKYKLIIRSKDGKRETLESSKNQFNLKLNPGDYDIATYVEDTYNRKSGISKTRKITVPDLNDELKAPSLSKLKIGNKTESRTPAESKSTKGSD